MTLASNSQSDGNLLVWRSAKSNLSTTVPDACAPNGIFLAPMDSSMTGLVSWVQRQIFLVLLHGRLPKIDPPVIGSLETPMVNRIGRPITNHPKKCKPMRAVKLAVNLDDDVPGALVYASGDLPGAAPNSRNAPFEVAGFRVVIEKFAQTLRRKIGSSHEAVLSLIGQRPDGVGSTARASLFSGIA